ncbi:MAG: TolC family outer membrane protein [Caulobacteraceae bacterium]
MSSRRALFCAAAFAFAGGSASAETLADAIALAYQSNPTLLSQRAQQRALDETYVQARAGWRPSVSVSGAGYWSRTDFGHESQSVSLNSSSSSIGSSGTGVGSGSSGVGGSSGLGSGGTVPVASIGSHFEENYGYGQITATQPIYTGGKTAATVQAAEATVMAGRQNLRGVETTLIQNVITAYEDVRRDQEILKIRTDNAALLRDQLSETQAKFQAGQLTRTDVAQGQAQLSSADALLATSKAQLQISRAEYAAVVGQNPGQLAPEPVLPGMPATVDQAFDAAESESPPLMQAKITEQSSRAKIAEAKAANRPTVSAQASYGAEGTLAPFAVRDFDRQVAGELVYSQPIFTGGLNSSLIRQAIQQNASDRIAIEGARRTVVQTVAQSWNTMVGDQASVVSNQQQVSAAEVAYEGLREQYRVGLSTTLDVLIQQQTLENAQLSLTQARHDEYVAEAALLAAMGRLEVADLVRGVERYDPAKSFNKVRNAGSLPWESLVAAIDTVGEPGMGAGRTDSQAAPSAGGDVSMVPADRPPPNDQPLSTVQPTAPIPDTGSSDEPPRLGAKPLAEPFQPQG